LAVTDGGLMAYTSDAFTPFRGAAGYVDQLLRGTKLEALPIQLPTTFALHINIATARSLGLEIPRELLVQAHRIVE
jgi:putative ABC transport system substrate-binding protein